jgi:hypothetical protein
VPLQYGLLKRSYGPSALRTPQGRHPPQAVEGRGEYLSTDGPHRHNRGLPRHTCVGRAQSLLHTGYPQLNVLAHRCIALVANLRPSSLSNQSGPVIPDCNR